MFKTFILQIAHPLVRDQLVKYIYNGFLVPVLGAALHQVYPKLKFLCATYDLLMNEKI